MVKDFITDKNGSIYFKVSEGNNSAWVYVGYDGDSPYDVAKRLMGNLFDSRKDIKKESDFIKSIYFALERNRLNPVNILELAGNIPIDFDELEQYNSALYYGKNGELMAFGDFVEYFYE